MTKRHLYLKGYEFIEFQQVEYFLMFFPERVIFLEVSVNFHTFYFSEGEALKV